MRCFFRVEYDGTEYGGWQVQPNAPSIQQQLQNAFSVVTRDACTITGAGRTDAGVHARGQGAHIDLPEHTDLLRMEMSVNGLLPKDIAIYGLKRVRDDFHARFSAKTRTYQYHIVERKMPLFQNRAWMLYHSVCWDKVSSNVKCLRGTHDFTTFCASGSSTDNMVCAVENATVEKKGELLIFTVTADRFIYKMIRSVIGTLIDIGRGQIEETIDSIILSKTRGRAGQTAPACGLVLEWVDYFEPEEL